VRFIYFFFKGGGIDCTLCRCDNNRRCPFCVWTAEGILVSFSALLFFVFLLPCFTRRRRHKESTWRVIKTEWQRLFNQGINFNGKWMSRRSRAAHSQRILKIDFHRARAICSHKKEGTHTHTICIFSSWFWFFLNLFFFFNIWLKP
jgi:hypothetical protein